MSYFELERLKVLQLVPVLNKTETKPGKSDKNSILIHTQSIYCSGKKRGIFWKWPTISCKNNCMFSNHSISWVGTATIATASSLYALDLFLAFRSDF